MSEFRRSVNTAPSMKEDRAARPVSRYLRAYFGKPQAWLGLAGLAVLATFMIVGHFLTDGAAETNVSMSNQGISQDHLLGTDRLGRDMLQRTLAATGLSLRIAAIATTIATAAGFAFGIALALLPTRWRSKAASGLDMALAFPPLFSSLFLIAVLGTGATGATVAVGIALVPSRARIAQTATAGIVERDFVALTRAAGVSRWRVVTRTVAPNLAEPFFVTLTGTAVVAMIATSALSFLGVGVQSPQYDWGRMLIESTGSFYSSPTVIAGPSLALVITGVTLTLLGEALATAMNPRLWQARPGAGPDRVVVGKVESPQVSTRPGTWIDAPRVLEVEGLRVMVSTSFGESEVVRGVDLVVYSGEVVGLVGESGSGKSMTAMAVAASLPDNARSTTDRWLVDGEEMSSASAPVRRRVISSRVAQVFQNPSTALDPTMKILSQVREALPKGGQRSRRMQNELIRQTFLEVGIEGAPERLRCYPHQFSGGMKQRVLIAMGLLREPALLIADEPTTALDKTTEAQVLQVIDKLNAKHGMAVLLISHDLRIVGRRSNRILVMYAGQVVEEGPTDVILKHPSHPYTKALIAAVVTPDSPRDQPLGTIPGEAPAAHAVGSGCAFAPRCVEATSDCYVETPVVVAVGERHVASCLRVGARLS